MIKIMHKIRPDKCMECNTDRSIELFDMYDRQVNYSYLIDQYEKGIILDSMERFDNRQLSYMMCKKCGKVYCIDWRDIHLPVPVRTFWYLENFLDKNYNKLLT